MPILIYGGIIARAGKRTSIPTTGDCAFHSSTEDGPDHALEATPSLLLLAHNSIPILLALTIAYNWRRALSLPFSLIVSFFMKTTEVCQGFCVGLTRGNLAQKKNNQQIDDDVVGTFVIHAYGTYRYVHTGIVEPYSRCSDRLVKIRKERANRRNT
eukprot:scaffold818_cov61-Attheya_sp.AAC.2